MRTLGVVQFYLPFALPRSEDWEGRFLESETAGQRILAFPMYRREHLFPRPVDQGLRDMVLVGGAPGRLAQKTVADDCYDRVRVHVIREVEGPLDDRIKGDMFDAAANCLDQLLRHCRAAAGDPNIQLFPRDGTGAILRMASFPHTVEWFDADSRAPIGPGEARGQLMVKPALSISFDVIERAIGLGVNPPLARMLLIDAMYHLQSFRPHEAGILLGTACEVASDTYMTRHGASETDPPIEAILSRRESFAMKRFHHLTNQISRRSLRDECPPVFKHVEAAYRLRNDLAHEARLSSWPGGVVASVKSAIEWLDAI